MIIPDYLHYDTRSGNTRRPPVYIGERDGLPRGNRTPGENENTRQKNLENRLKNRLPNALSVKNVEIDSLMNGESIGVQLGESLLYTFRLQEPSHPELLSHWLETLSNKRALPDNSYFVDKNSPDTILQTKSHWDGHHDIDSCVFFSLESIVDERQLGKESMGDLKKSLRQIVHGTLLTALLAQCSPRIDANQGEFRSSRGQGVISYQDGYPNKSITDSTTYQYTLYTVQRGDTLTKIAQRFDVTVDDIKIHNNIQGSAIYAGANIRIPPSNTQTVGETKSIHMGQDLNFLFSPRIDLDTINSTLGYAFRNPSDKGASFHFSRGMGDILRSIGKDIGIIPGYEESSSVDYIGKSVSITQALLISLQSYLHDAGINLPIQINSQGTLTNSYASLKKNNKVPEGMHIYHGWKSELDPEKFRSVLDGKDASIYVFTFIKGEEEHACLAFRTNDGYIICDPSYGGGNCFYLFDEYMQHQQKQGLHLQIVAGLKPSWGHIPNIPEEERSMDIIAHVPTRIYDIIQTALLSPKGNLRGEQPENIAPDKVRLTLIAEKIGIGEKIVPEVRYANLCGANIRAIYASTVAHLSQQGIKLPYIWPKNAGNATQIGSYFRMIKAQGNLPSGAKVIDGLNQNPDPKRFEKLLLDTGNDFFIMTYTHAPHGHVNIARRMLVSGKEKIVIFDPSWTGATLTDDMGTPAGYHDFQDYITSFVLGEKIQENGHMVHGKAPNRYTPSTVLCLSTSGEGNTPPVVVHTSNSPDGSDTQYSLDSRDKKLSKKIDNYIQNRVPRSPVKGSMVLSACEKYTIPPEYLLAIMVNDSNLGTTGKAVRTRNPGNVGNDDDGNEITHATWEEGVMAAGKNLSWRIKAFHECYPDKSPLLSYLVTNAGPDGKGFMISQKNYKKINPEHYGCYMTHIEGQKNVVKLALTIRGELGTGGFDLPKDKSLVSL